MLLAENSIASVRETDLELAFAASRNLTAVLNSTRPNQRDATCCVRSSSFEVMQVETLVVGYGLSIEAQSFCTIW